MGSPSERVRRILSDGALDGVLPASRLPEREGAPPPSRPERVEALRARLRALGLDRAPPGEDEAAGDLAPFEDDADDRPLAVQVGAEVRETRAGTCLYLERRIPLERRHGRAALSDALEHTVALRAHERGPDGPGRLAPADAVFLDTETTGLAGGTGTVAFLVGTGRVEGTDFVVRQYCMRDYPDEAALLAALDEDLAGRPLVTFNGRSFDWPLLVTRWRLHRMSPAARAHLDLLPPARRLWADTLPSRSLGALEAHVLGLEREDDLPGWRIPQAWFDYLRTGRAGLVAKAFRHNEVDVLSMLALMGRVGAILAEPAARSRATARDLVGTARLLLETGETTRARACLEAGIARIDGPEQMPLRRVLAHLCRRLGDVEASLAHWTHVSRRSLVFDPEAFEEVAKIHEHRRRDPGEALRWVREALAHVAPGGRAEAAFRHREARLQRRLAGAARGARELEA